MRVRLFATAALLGLDLASGATSRSLNVVTHLETSYIVATGMP